VRRFINATLMLFAVMMMDNVCFAQTGGYSISGQVIDAQRQPISGVVLRLINDSLGVLTDTDGRFSISNRNKGLHLLSFDILGFNKLALKLNLVKDTNLTIVLSSNENELKEIVVNGEKMLDLHTVTQSELKGIALLQSRGLSLGESLKELPGLNSIQTGPTLSKPVIHGLHSNRVLIINNGVRQEGQQWGSEHAPEIDPFIANKIVVVKGAASVRYGSDAVGGVVLLGPDDLPQQKGITGDVYLVGASNGRLAATSAMLQGTFDKALTGLSWRVQGTLKEAGNFHTPNYYLDNTGFKEGDFSANVGYKWKGFDFKVYYSQYNTKTGIFSGAESGNLQELLDKFKETRPATPDDFSYDIKRSYQTINHDLLKTSATYRFNNSGKLELIYGVQKDKRKEYDADLPFSSNPSLLTEPQLSFQLNTQTLDLVYTQAGHNGWTGSFGFTGNTQGNIYSGIRYLIPNFRSYEGGLFLIQQYVYHKFTFEAGLRYDYRWLRVYQRNPTTLALYNSTFDYSNATGTVGGTYRYNSHFSASLNVGTAWRAPSINELYINGVHFSDASYQIGDSALHLERAINTSLSLHYTSDKLRVSSDFYYNNIWNYIYEKPLPNPITTIGGTYPAFVYTQNDVRIMGLDLDIEYDFLPHFTFQSKTTLVRGYNKSLNEDLIYMPADRFENGLEYHFNTIGNFKAPYISLQNVSVLKQTRVAPGLDYVPPPAAYSLFNAHFGFDVPLKKNILKVDFSVANMTNVAYRDYLNHFRYYADELGTNFTLRLKYSF
jgi:iron complex outermembrane recepter protein